MVWMAPALNPGGYSSEALSYAMALEAEYAGAKGKRKPQRFGLKQFAEQQDQQFVEGLPAATKQVLAKLFTTGAQRTAWEVAVCHSTPDVWHADGAFGWGRVQPCPPRGVVYTVGRTMYETDRLPDTWVPRINAMDEVWVPSHFAVDQFASSGVDRAKIFVVPEAVDVELFDPARHKALDWGAVPGGGGSAKPDQKEEVYRFLSVFKWERRKGWDVLLQAFFEEFSAEDPVVLQIKTQAFHSDGDFDGKIRAHVASLGSRARMPLARYRVLSDDLAVSELPRLYRGADAFVLPTRGEGWGRPHVEAMAMGLPVIATNWSGSTEFLSSRTALPLRVKELREVEEGNGPKGHRWAEPSVEHLRELMRWAVEHRAEAQEIGSRARAEMLARYAPEVIVQEHVLPQLQRIAKSLRKRRPSQEL